MGRGWEEGGKRVTVNFFGQTGIHRNSTGILPKFKSNPCIPVETFVYVTVDT